MARFEMKMPDEFMDKLGRLEDKADVVIPRALEAGGQVVLEAVRSNLAAVIGRGTKYPSRATGELLSALGVSPAKRDREDNMNVKVGFGEPHSGGVSNAMLANLLEYGKSGQPPRPFLKPAKSASRKACIAAMSDVLNHELGDV